MAPDRKTHFHTMSNPNTNAIISMLRGALQGTKSTATGFKIVHIGIDKLPVTIRKMAPLNGKSCEKNIAMTASLIL